MTSKFWEKMTYNLNAIKSNHSLILEGNVLLQNEGVNPETWASVLTWER